MIARAPATGDIVVLAIHEGGLRKPFGVKGRWSTPADWKGKTIRAPESQVLATASAPSAPNPNPMPLPDVYQALATARSTGWRPTSA